MSEPVILSREDWISIQKENAELKTQLENVTEKFYLIYSGINLLMGVLGADGEISTKDNVSSEMMDILYNFDGGRFIHDKVQFINKLNQPNKR